MWQLFFSNFLPDGGPVHELKHLAQVDKCM